MILHIGKNDGSHQNNTVKQLRKQGIDCRGMTFYYSQCQEYDEILCFRKWQFILYYLTFIYFALKSELVHLWSEQLPGIVLFLKLINKPYVIEWTGSDIRNPNYALIDSVNAYVIGSPERYSRNMNAFTEVINIFSSHILIDHVPHKNKVHIPHRLDLDRFKFNPTYHNPLRVAHCSSHREAKGTDKILEIVKGIEGIEFDLIENVSRAEALERISECDLVIGQMVWGEHGTQELESIAMGKPVLCYIEHDKPTPVTKCRLDEIAKWIKFFQDNPQLIKVEAQRSYNDLLTDFGIQKLMNLYSEIIIDKEYCYTNI